MRAVRPIPSRRGCALPPTVPRAASTHAASCAILQRGAHGVRAAAPARRLGLAHDRDWHVRERLRLLRRDALADGHKKVAPRPHGRRLRSGVRRAAGLRSLRLALRRLRTAAAKPAGSGRRHRASATSSAPTATTASRGATPAPRAGGVTPRAGPIAPLPLTTARRAAARARSRKLRCPPWAGSRLWCSESRCVPPRPTGRGSCGARDVTSTCSDIV